MVHGRSFVAGCLVLCLSLLCCAPLLAWQSPAELASRKARWQQDYQQKVVPWFKRYCHECHSGDDAEAGLNLVEFPGIEALQADRKRWTKVLRMVEFAAMPPEGSQQPSAEERRAMVRLLEPILYTVDCEQRRDPGRVTIRRLNRAEYNNTIRDLMAVDFKPAENFPSDDVGHGFDNIGDVLSLPPLLFEKYLDAAEQVVEAAIVLHDPDHLPRRRFVDRQLRTVGSVRYDEPNRAYLMPSHGAVTARFTPRYPGRYRLRVEAAAQQAGTEFAKMQVELDRKSVRVFDVQANRNAMKKYVVEVDLKPQAYELAAAFINDYYNPKARNPRERDRNLYVRAIEIEGPLELDPASLPASHRQVMIAEPGKTKSVKDAAREILSPFVRRAFRRPVGSDEVETYVNLVDHVYQQEKSFTRAIQVAVSGVLVSPHFLFRIESQPSANDPSTVHAVTPHELATRLSYFLWSSMPDEQLFALARDGSLSQPGVLRKQVQRMLADTRSRALVDNFVSQWLNLRNLDEVSPDPDQFKTFSKELRQDMRTETELFVEDIIRQDRSVLEVLTGEFTFVNPRLARHYGIDGVEGDTFRRVSLQGLPRQGILTHASILTLTSNPTGTSPVKRGKWILANILGTPPPDPPADVPELAAVQKASPQATLKEQLELHRKNASCAICHRQMDPLGLGLENFDAVGRWREKDEGKVIDASGSLPNGDKFSNPAELVRVLGKRRQDFCRALAGKMLTYATGRGLQYYDRCVVDDITKAMQQGGNRFSVLVTEVVLSDPFRKKRGDGD